MALFWFICGLLFLLPVLAPKGKWLAWSSGMVAIAFAALWAIHGFNSSRLDYNSSVADTVGMMVVACLTAAFLLGLFVRYIVWLIELKREDIRERNMRRKIAQSPHASSRSTVDGAEDLPRR